MGGGRAACKEMESVRSPPQLKNTLHAVRIKNQVVASTERKERSDETGQDSCDSLRLASFQLASATFTLAAQTHSSTTGFVFFAFAANASWWNSTSGFASHNAAHLQRYPMLELLVTSHGSSESRGAEQGTGCSWGLRAINAAATGEGRNRRETEAPTEENGRGGKEKGRERRRRKSRKKMKQERQEVQSKKSRGKSFRLGNRGRK